MSGPRLGQILISEVQGMFVVLEAEFGDTRRKKADGRWSIGIMGVRDAFPESPEADHLLLLLRDAVHHMGTTVLWLERTGLE